MKLAPLVVAASTLSLGLMAHAQTPTDAAETAAAPAPAVAATTVEEAKADPANWRTVDPERLFIFDTNKGRILIEAFPEVAPKHYDQFSKLIRSGDLDGTTFHRVINGFMAQGGDIYALKGRESGLPDIPGEFTYRRNPAEMPLTFAIGPADTAKYGYVNGFPMMTQASFFSEMSKDGMVESWIPHCRGVVSTARTSDPNSANSQFFLMRDTSQHLDKEYTAWGRVVQGEDVVLAIKAGKESLNGEVALPDILMHTKVAADLPKGERPNVWVERTDGPNFMAAHADIDEDLNVCDLPSVPAVVER
ncbi:MAG: peptidylprolyl isomerase [Alphaproteobacteria bacterium]|nr:peptidylprolyl isomerase [Alphaproteobacteria bacterium]MBU2082616.1 peptidylprolyl isomerase [Alphaproteobacteria bacterium]MBU2142287.1 peptidylprolyl isomerase [Alphaproteobacteria bacterium]MBU2196670.1 peptidylprolyl isomerase [Alphaproteobacteria bacterium]